MAACHAATGRLDGKLADFFYHALRQAAPLALARPMHRRHRMEKKAAGGRRRALRSPAAPMTGSLVTHLQSLEEFLKKTEDKIQAPGFSVTAQTVQDVVDDVRVRQVAMMKQLVCACNVQNFVLPIKPHTPTDAFLATLMQEQALLERES